MAHFISPDGRVINFEAEIKADGTVRPKSFRNFINDNVSPEKGVQTTSESVDVASKNKHFLNKRTSSFHSLSKNERKKVRRLIDEKLRSLGLNSWIQQILNSWYVSLNEVYLDDKKIRQLMVYDKDIDKLKSAVNQINLFIRNVTRVGKDSKNDESSTVLEYKKDTTPRTLSATKSIGGLSGHEFKIFLTKIKSYLGRKVANDQIPPKIGEFICESYEEIYSTIESPDWISGKINGTKLEKYSSIIFQLIKQCNQIMVDQLYVTKTNSSHNSKGTHPQKQNVQNKYTTSMKPVREMDESVLQRRSSISENANLVQRGNRPRFGYARDYFGRVQERDSYREDRPVNPYHSRSNFDREDDNESLDMLD